MNTRIRLALCFAVFLTGTLAADKKAENAQAAQAVLLDHAEFLCKNCLLGMSDYYFCFDLNSKILIGHEKIRVQMRKQLPDLEKRGSTVPIRFNDEYIWIPGPKTEKGNGKDQRLTQDYTHDPFIFSDTCQRAVKKTEDKKTETK